VEPWKRVFNHIFGEGTAIKKIRETGIHFYLTRSDVERGELVCATNNPECTKIPGVKYDTLNMEPNKFANELRKAVFASMDLPPLFPYIKLKDSQLEDRYFEDGGVIDNLPISFAALEGCDLIFVLPLNHDFKRDVNLRSIFARLFRVMDVRQGVLERKSFRDLYLYNELADLRDYAKALEEKVDNRPEIPADSHLADALSRKHRKISIFAVCPDRDFVLSTINTQEFWKQKEAKKVFKKMYDTSWKILEEIDSAEQEHTPEKFFKKLQLFSINKCGEYDTQSEF
jgi:predicted acylesterase/phospholipase RssA